MQTQKSSDERSDGPGTLLIASYRERYTEDSLNKIREILKKEKPDKIVILKIIEEQSVPEVLDANVGMKEKDDFLDTVLEEKKNQADEYASDLIEVAEESGIPTDVRLRKGQEIAEEIIDDSQMEDVYHVIIHGSTKDSFEKLLEGSIAKEVKKGISEKNITLLE